ncbi:MAG: glycyl-radical enzyme activating protein [Opitutaceae bacterium]|jgi:pyruvate formate lyase activating enzyme
MPSPTGIVFDIQRSSLHDGPGLRTTVFLKGCPLRCQWCHNPESQALRPQLGFDAEKCTACRACVETCPSGVHSFDTEGRHRIAWDRCECCAACVGVCPSGALKIHGAAQSVDEVMAIALRDRAYYASSGGGLTLSGGEPTMQLEFSLALLRAAKAAGIHTCVETCGIGAPDTYAKLLGLCDLFLYDYKASNEDAHRKYTGAPLAPILRNLRWLHAQGAAIFLRCPIIPGVNDNPEHFRAIAALSCELQGLRGVEILAYHSIGLAKYDRIGRGDTALRPPVPGQEQIQSWHRSLLSAGCRNLMN